MILTALAHTAGNLAATPDTPAEIRLFSEMSSFRVPLGMGMSPSMQDIFRNLAFTMSITFAALGLINLLLAASPDVSATILHRVSWVNALWVGAFLILSWVYRVPPPLISGAMIEAVVLAFVIVSKRVPQTSVRT